MKNIFYNSLVAFVALCFFSSCNKEWEDEQFYNYVSFKAPLNLAEGSTNIYIRYNPGGKVTYKLPIIVSGSNTHTDDINVHVGLDLDTLASINKDHYNVREDLYYRVLRDDQYEFEETTLIPGGQDVALLDLNFMLGEIDLKDKWVLPLQIKKDPSYGYTANPRKNYSKAILRIIPFNDYSGVYTSGNVNVYVEGSKNDPMTTNTRTSHVVDDNTIFFYAGLQDEDLLERSSYKIFATFNEDGTLSMSAEDPKIDFKVIGNPTYEVTERFDDTLPYLLHKYVIMKFEYSFVDYTSVPGDQIAYRATGSMTMERNINTEIPDEDQAIEW